MSGSDFIMWYLILQSYKCICFTEVQGHPVYGLKDRDKTKYNVYFSMTSRNDPTGQSTPLAYTKYKSHGTDFICSFSKAGSEGLK